MDSAARPRFFSRTRIPRRRPRRILLRRGAQILYGRPSSGRDARGGEEPRGYHVAAERDDLPRVCTPRLAARYDPRDRRQIGIAMAENPIDLRSDTVTKPSAAMRKAMA